MMFVPLRVLICLIVLCAVAGDSSVACFHPVRAVRLEDGSVRFVSSNHPKAVSDLTLACGQCVGCRLERSRQWAMRCMHEAQLHEENAFITLTYSPENLPADRSLNYRHFQLFMKRIRKRAGVKISFYMGGEYGENLNHPHYHACIFGYDFPDKKYHAKSGSGCKVYTSEILSSLWPYGYAWTGSVTFESAAYIARYCMKKVTGDNAESHYQVIIPETGEIVQILPEFNHMSLKPAIGRRWLEKYQSDVYPRDFVVVNGVKCKPPKYYDRIFLEYDYKAKELIDYERFVKSRLIPFEEQLPERLRVREICTEARISNLIRS